MTKMLFVTVLILLLLSTSLTAEESITKDELTVIVPDSVTETITVNTVNRSELDPEGMEWTGNTFTIGPDGLDLPDANENSVILEYQTIDTLTNITAKKYINISDCIINSTVTIESSGIVTIEDTTLEAGANLTVRAKEIVISGNFDSGDVEYMELESVNIEPQETTIIIDLNKANLTPGINPEDVTLYYFDYNSNAWLPMDNSEYDASTNSINATVDKLGD